MAINTSKVIVGGLVAGAVLNALDFVLYTYLLGPRMMADLTAVSPTLVERANSGNAMIANICLDFVLGIMLTWLYAAVRPRFGAGMRTAVYVALFVWFLFGIAYTGYYLMGMMSGGTWLMSAAGGLVNLLIGASIGGRLYTETTSTVGAPVMA